MCQRPKRAFFISTEFENADVEERINRCQRPKRAFFISTLSVDVIPTPGYNKLCQRPKRAFFISTVSKEVGDE